MARDIRIALVGFGNVGRRFAEQLRGPYARALKAAGARVRVTGIATARHGIAIDPRGLDLGRALRLVAKGGSLDAAAPRPAGRRRARLHRSRAGRRPGRDHDPRPEERPAGDRARAAGPRPRDARRHRQQGAGGLRPAAAAGPRRAEEAALPPRGRGDGRDARLQPRRALPAGRAHRLLPRHAQQHHEPGALAHGGRPHRQRRGEGGPAPRHRRGRPAQRPRGLGRGGEGLRDRQRPHGRGGAARRRCGGAGSRVSPGSTRGARCGRGRGCGSSSAASGRGGACG